MSRRKLLWSILISWLCVLGLIGFHTAHNKITTYYYTYTFEQFQWNCTNDTRILTTEIMDNLKRYALEIESQISETRHSNSDALHASGLGVINAKDKGYMEKIIQTRNTRIVVFKSVYSVFSMIMPPRMYAVHSNNCGGLQHRAIDYSDVYNLNCIETANYHYLDIRTYEEELARCYDYHPGFFHSHKFVSAEKRNFEKNVTGLGYLHVVKDGFVASNGDFATGNNYVEILRCGAGEHAQIKLDVEKHDTVFSIAQYWGSGFFHFTIEDLPRIAVALPFLLKNPNIKVHVTDSNSFTKSLLMDVGISEDRLIDGSVQAKTLIVPPGTPCGTASAIPINLLSLFLRKNSHTDATRDTIVLVKRSQKRWFDYHNSILDMLRSAAKEFHLRVEVFSDHPAPSYSATKGMFSRAVIVVAPHGAGLSNLVFSPPGTCVIEGLCFDGQNKLNLCYKHLAQVLGHVYHGVVPKQQCMQTTAAEIVPQVNQCLKYITDCRT